MNIIKNEMPPASHEEINMWSYELEHIYGKETAKAIEIGTRKILDYITKDIQILSILPAGTHIGEVPYSYLKDLLPKQFLMNYNYDFYYLSKCRVLDLIEKIDGSKLENTFDKILFYIIAILGYAETEKDIEDIDTCDKIWLNDILPDRHILNLFYEGGYHDEKNIYHFKNWNQNTQ